MKRMKLPARAHKADAAELKLTGKKIEHLEKTIETLRRNNLRLLEAHGALLMVKHCEPDPTLIDRIPPEVRDAALLVENHFKSIGVSDWQFMGLASRSLVDIVRPSLEPA